MSSKSQDWSALASHNERVAPDGYTAAPSTGTDTGLQPAKRTAQVKSRLRLRKRAGRPGTAARA